MGVVGECSVVPDSSVGVVLTEEVVDLDVEEVDELEVWRVEGSLVGLAAVGPG
jgi:hypothetical protein